MSGNDDMDLDDHAEVTLEDLTWEDLDHSHARGDFEVFHDLHQEMHVLTGQ